MIPANYAVNQGPSTTPGAIQSELAHYGSPLTPYAQNIYDWGIQYNVDPAFFMGTVFGENWYGTYPGNGAWDASSQSGTFNWASISNASYGGHAVPGTRWGQYPSIAAGIEAFFRLIPAEYYSMGQTTLESIWWGIGGTCSPCVDGQHAYGPCSDNHGDCSSLQTAIDVMNRIQSSGGNTQPNPNPIPTSPCPAGQTFDPTQNLCLSGGIDYTGIPATTAVAVAVGLILLGTAGILASRTL